MLYLIYLFVGNFLIQIQQLFQLQVINFIFSQLLLVADSQKYLVLKCNFFNFLGICMLEFLQLPITRNFNLSSISLKFIPIKAVSQNFMSQDQLFQCHERNLKVLTIH